ncbi:MAG TPA: alpha/beta fold hydrolase [Steroidobacter sp.]
MQRWARHFTCIAPDTPGYGQSDPLPGEPDIRAFAQALLEFLDAIGLKKTAAYGFHTGGMVLVNAMRRDPHRFTTLAIGGYAVWTREEMAMFDQFYLPPFRPSPYGEHLTWLWNRCLEQTWFFPWFDVRDCNRLSVAHDDPLRIDGMVRDILESGDAYRTAYGAALRSSSDIPGPDAITPPVLIAAYNGDPLQAHIERLGAMPPNWKAQPVATPSDLEAVCLAHLLQTPTPPCPPLAESNDGGFVRVTQADFDGLIHWRGAPDATTVLLHGPGRSVELLELGDALAIDLPGHGLSDDWPADCAPDLSTWGTIVAAAITAIGVRGTPLIVGEGWSALLAAQEAIELGARGWGAICAHIPLPQHSPRWQAAIPDPSPDRFGQYLAATWSAVRAAHFFWPWFEAKAANAIPFSTASIAPEQLAREHLSMIRARAGRNLLRALIAVDRHALVMAAPTNVIWEMAEWARKRHDLWTPGGGSQGAT